MNSSPHTQFFVLWTIWISFLAGLVGLLVIAQNGQNTFGNFLEMKIPILWLRTFFYCIAIILFPIIRGIKKFLRYKSKSTLSNPEMTNHPRSSILSMISLIASLVVAELIAILGFILFLLGDTLQTLYIFVGLSALAMLLHRPKAEEYT